MLARQLAAIAAALTLSALSACSTLGDPLFVGIDGPTPDARPGPDAPPPVDAMPIGPTFESIRQNVLHGQCGVKCHSTINPAGNLNMESGDVHSRLVGVATAGLLCGPPEVHTRVVAGEPDMSVLYLKVASRHMIGTLPCGAGMPEAPLSNSPISLAELDAIRMWIEAGALDD